MLFKIVLFFGLVMGGIVFMHRCLNDRRFLAFCDTHPQPAVMPKVLYTVGQSYALFQNLSEAATYYYRVGAQYPQSSEAENAAYFYLQAEDDLKAMPPEALTPAYQKYLDRFPAGVHAEAARSRLSSLQVTSPTPS